MPSNAQILPAQAFVDASGQIATFVSAGTTPNFANMSITTFSGALALGLFNSIGNGTITFAGNALNVTSVNAILAAAVETGFSEGILNLTGGTNAAPTGQGATDKAALNGDGWTVTTN